MTLSMLLSSVSSNVGTCVTSACGPPVLQVYCCSYPCYRGLCLLGARTWQFWRL